MIRQCIQGHCGISPASRHRDGLTPLPTPYSIMAEAASKAVARQLPSFKLGTKQVFLYVFSFPDSLRGHSLIE